MTIFGNERSAPEYEKSKTAVWWDMDTCPVPDGYDARRVRPVTITAKGNLENTPAHVLQALSSTGIVVQHYVPDMVGGHIFLECLTFKRLNPAPATIMLISDKVETELSQHLCRSQQCDSGYNLVLAYTITITWRTRLLYTTAQWLWKTILAEGNKQETARYVLRKCTDQSGESVSVSCKSCHLTGLSLTDFTRHLSTREHKQMEIDIIRASMPDTGDEDEPSNAKANTCTHVPRKIKRSRKAFRTRKEFRTRKAFRTNHVLLLTKRRSPRKS